MNVHLDARFAGSSAARQAEAVLRKCVHCGFCLATCPTYQVLGDELDSPRGRIYLVKQLLEGQEPTAATQVHLDRCLTCRSCESTCPSGVEYVRLIEFGREVVEERVPRPRHVRLVRRLLREGLTSRHFAWAAGLGTWLRPLLPRSLQVKLPRPSKPGPAALPVPTPDGPARDAGVRKVVMLEGCVQPSLMPSVNEATRRVLARVGIQAQSMPSAGCCGAIRLHLADREGALDDMRRNIDAWWPMISRGSVEAIAINASGCGVTVKEYGRYLADDPQYAAKAQRVSELARDIAEIIAPEAAQLRRRMGPGAELSVHVPCTLQHGQRLPQILEQVLRDLGLAVRPASSEAHLCCGSAGTYALLEPAIATRLRDRKLDDLGAAGPCQVIVSANIGCIQHLQSGTETPVRHWIELVDGLLLGNY
jgi:glycolate oxidase iron-sulfur subunit